MCSKTNTLGLKEKIIKLLADIILKNYNLELKDLSLELPPKKELGDFAFPCFQLSRYLKKSPNFIAEELEFLISENISEYDILEDVSIAGPYLNIKINILNVINDFRGYNVKKFKVNYKGGTIVVDYIGANVGKPLHIGHMCTPNQGQAMINIYKKLGYKVISDSHIGDWGIIFGKLITAFKKYGNEDELKDNAVEHLFQLYVKISKQAEEAEDLDNIFRKEFKLLSHGDNNSVQLWENFTKDSIKAMNIQLARLNVKPDYNIGESFYEGLGLPKMEDYPDLEFSMESIVKELIEKNIATKNDDNSVGVVFSDESKLSSCILQKRDGTHGYLASDLASIKYRIQNWNPEKIIYFVDSRQQLHLKQAFEIASKAGWLKHSQPLLSDEGSKIGLFHAYNGFISLKDGAMSTRNGKIIKLDKLLDEAETRAEKIILEKRDDISGAELKELSKIIGIGAIKYGYLKKSREIDIIFDWDEFMTFEGNSGPYIQYAYVRARRILEKSGLSEEIVISENYDDIKDEIKEESLILSKLLLSYNSNKSPLNQTIEKNMPHILAGYAYELTKAFNAFYNNVEVLKEENEKLKLLNLKLTKDFSETIKDVFTLLGIDMPEKM